MGVDEKHNGGATAGNFNVNRQEFKQHSQKLLLLIFMVATRIYCTIVACLEIFLDFCSIGRLLSSATGAIKIEVVDLTRPLR